MSRHGLGRGVASARASVAVAVVARARRHGTAAGATCRKRASSVGAGLIETWTPQLVPPNRRAVRERLVRPSPCSTCTRTCCPLSRRGSCPSPAPWAPSSPTPGPSPPPPLLERLGHHGPAQPHYATCSASPRCPEPTSPLPLPLHHPLPRPRPLQPPATHLSALGTTVQPRRTPVKPAYLEKEHVSMATSSAPVWEGREGGQGRGAGDGEGAAGVQEENEVELCMWKCRTQVHRSTVKERHHREQVRPHGRAHRRAFGTWPHVESTY